MASKIPWFVFILIFIGLIGYFLTQEKIQQAGDIAEYFGITESLINHASVELTLEDRQNLERRLHPVYFNDPGYYIYGRNNSRYPVHFVFYSLLAAPVRLALRLIHQDELKALAFTNVLVVTITAFVVLKKFLQNPGQKLVFLITFFLSPLLSFIAWPGPDVLFMCLLLIGVWLFFKKNYLGATLLSAFASWHSQPLAVLTLGFLVSYIIQETKIIRQGKHHIAIPFTIFIGIGGSLGLLSIPYLYNYLAFGTWTPWTLLRDGWTLAYGFGLHNASLKKLFESLFDLNMGLFWYAPLIVLASFYPILKGIKLHKNILYIIILLIITGVFYQTNPAWHYGAAGYGPSRHILYFLPFLIYFIVDFYKSNVVQIVGILIIFISQVGILSLNGFIEPNFERTLYHSPFAVYVLDNYPQLYNPTPEIFVDRTNHTDNKIIETAIYKSHGVCRKAYILKTEVEKLRQICGNIPETYTNKLDNEFLRKANYSRQVKTIEATFWPDTASCSDEYRYPSSGPYQCMKTVEEVIQLTGIKDRNRFKPVENFTGVWRIDRGDPIDLTVPPGYIIHHYSFEGAYVNYENP